MAKTDQAGSEDVPPKTPDGIIEAIRRLAPSARTADALTLWHVGDLLHQLRATGEDAPVAVIRQRTDRSDRELRYCVQVRSVFERRERVEQLVNKGMRWSALRELASKSLDEYRDGLIQDFESGRCNTTELRREAVALRYRIERKVRADYAGEGRGIGVHRAAAGVISATARLRGKLARAEGALQRALAAMAATLGVPLKPAALGRVRSMRKALAELQTETQAVLDQSAALTGGRQMPPGQEKKANRRKGKVPGPEPVRAKVRKRRQ